MNIKIPPSSETTKDFLIFIQEISLNHNQAQKLGVVSIGNENVPITFFHIDYPSHNADHNTHWDQLFRGEPRLDNFLENIGKTFFPNKKGSPRNLFIEQNLVKPNICIVVGHGEVYAEIDNRVVGGYGEDPVSLDYESYLINSITKNYPNLSSLIIAICSPDSQNDTRDYCQIQKVNYPIFFARNSVPFFGNALNVNGAVNVLINGEIA